MLALTGANGQLGRLVLKTLADRNIKDVRALVRSPDKAADLASDTVTLVEADYDRPDTLDAALEGVERLLLISGSEIGQRTRQHAAVIDAAKKAGVSFIVYTSLINTGSSPMILAQEHETTEAALKASGIAHVILRNGWYLENYAGTVDAALAHGAVVGGSGDGLISAASRKDYAEAAAITLTGDDTSTRIHELGGAPALTLAELAAEISAQTGRDIPFQNLPQADYAKVLVGAGLPQGFADVLADTDAAAAKGALYTASTDLEDIIGHPTLSLKAFVSSALS
ncbi:SDR family oxidoreductase [Labrenzia sp. CE80]|uniref:SDR family oxidoreductase n=1 Tax=Labrenzia sp. CE80 TaxID=1788986 RepID=UPI00129A8809|nr:SDR family oxidoreductase [Labrenzia sp. CE80]